MTPNDLPEPLQAIAEEAGRLTGGACAIRLHEKDGERALVIELGDDSIVEGRLLHKRLKAFCARQGYPRAYLIVAGTRPRFLDRPDVPGGWPPDEQSADG